MAHSDSEKLYAKHLKALKEKPILTNESHNPGPSLAQFVESVAGMGERARKNGTIALSVRTRKSKPTQ